MIYTLVQYTKKITTWHKNLDAYTARGMRDMMKALKEEVRQAYSGDVVGIKTGKTQKQITSKFDSRKLEASVFFKNPRAFIARFQEGGTIYQRARPVMGPLREKYTGKTGKAILKSLIKGYKKSGR